MKTEIHVSNCYFNQVFNYEYQVNARFNKEEEIRYKVIINRVNYAAGLNRL